jgi:chromosome segregation ATPase
LAGQVSASQSALIQRQEELAQLLNQFHEAERARVRAEAECEHERDRRIQSEQRMTSADAEISALQSDLQEARRTAERKVDALTTDLARMTVLLQEQERAAEQAAAEASQSAAETLRLSQEVEQLSEATSAAQVARGEAERKLAARFDELARLTAITADEASRADSAEDGAQWLRDVRRVEEGFPAWWAIMPGTWRRRRAHQRYHRAGLFDAQAYLELYPDVSAQGMDPVRHFILHGMAEGRARLLP